MSPDDNTLIALGLIARPRGLSGEVFVRAYNESNPGFRANLPVEISIKGESINTTIESVKWYGKKLGVKFKNINDRNQAENLRGFEVSTQLKNLPQKKDGEFFVFDLVGLDIIDVDEQVFGKIKNVLNLPANDALVIEHSDGETLVPFVKEIIDDVDLKRKRVKISRIREFLI